MKVLLISPINRSYVVMPSLGLGYIAAVLRGEGHEVEILHCLKEGFTFHSFADYIRRNKFNIYGIQMFSYDITPAKKRLKIIKKYNPDSVTIVGGYHPSGDPDGVLESLECADYGLVSEVEIGYPILQYLGVS